MLIRIITAYISESYVIAITAGESYRFPHRLKQEKAEALLKAVIDAQRIETDKWKVI